MQLTQDDAAKILSAFAVTQSVECFTEADREICERLLDAFPNLKTYKFILEG